MPRPKQGAPQGAARGPRWVAAPGARPGRPCIAANANRSRDAAGAATPGKKMGEGEVPGRTRRSGCV